MKHRESISEVVPLSDFDAVCAKAKQIAPPTKPTQHGFVALLIRAQAILRRQRSWDRRRAR